LFFDLIGKIPRCARMAVIAIYRVISTPHTPSPAMCGEWKSAATNDPGDHWASLHWGPFGEAQDKIVIAARRFAHRRHRLDAGDVFGPLAPSIIAAGGDS
jgi:hypothetical protein